MRNTFGLTGLALAAVVVIAPPGVAAGAPQASQPKQPQPQPPAITEQVEVVATRLAEPPHEVPAAIEVIAGDTLRAMNARTLPQALALASGVDVTGGGDAGPAGAVPEFRGLREFDAFLLVVDGIPWGGAFNPALTTLSLRDIDRASTLRAYCLARLEEHFGELRERKLDCRKVGCGRKRLSVANYCVEHLIAERFGRHLAKLDAATASKRA